MRFATGAGDDGAAESRAGAVFLYSFRLDEVMPDDHPVREIAAVLDLSWVHSELAPYYSHVRGGRWSFRTAKTKGGHRPQPPASAVAGDEWPPLSYSGREQQVARIEPLLNRCPDLRPRSSRNSPYVHRATLANDTK